MRHANEEVLSVPRLLNWHSARTYHRGHALGRGRHAEAYREISRPGVRMCAGSPCSRGRCGEATQLPPAAASCSRTQLTSSFTLSQCLRAHSLVATPRMLNSATSWLVPSAPAAKTSHASYLLCRFKEYSRWRKLVFALNLGSGSSHSSPLEGSVSSSVPAKGRLDGQGEGKQRILVSGDWPPASKGTADGADG